MRKAKAFVTVFVAQTECSSRTPSVRKRRICYPMPERWRLPRNRNDSQGYRSHYLAGARRTLTAEITGMRQSQKQQSNTVAPATAR
jgi:hypothetical protein